MSLSGGEEEAELCELMTAALEHSGVLADVRARLRAGLYLALERSGSGGDRPAQLEPPALLALQLAHELLDGRLPHSAAVLRAESGRVYPPRRTLARRLRLDHDSGLPLLVQLVSALDIPESPDTTFTSDSSGSPADSKDETPRNDEEIPDSSHDDINERSKISDPKELDAVSQYSNKTELYDSSVFEEILSNNVSNLDENRLESAASLLSEIVNTEEFKDSSRGAETPVDAVSNENNPSNRSILNNIVTSSSVSVDSSKKTEIVPSEDRSNVSIQYSNRTDTFDDSVSEEIISQNDASDKSK